MLKLRRGKELALFLKRFQHQRVRVLAENAGPRRLLGHLAAVVDQLDKGQVIGAADLGVVLAESGRSVHDAGAVGQGDIVVAGDVPALFRGMDKVEQRFVLPVFQRFAREGIQDLRLVAQHGRHEVLGHIIDFAAALYARVRLVGMDAERDV